MHLNMNQYELEIIAFKYESVWSRDKCTQNMNQYGVEINAFKYESVWSRDKCI